jgi:hypothetical protein
MLHLRNQILEHRIGHIADEQIALAVLGREEMFIRIRGFRCHPTHIRGFRYRVKRFGVSGAGARFGVSGAKLRGFGCDGFGVSGAKLRGFRYRGLKIRERAEGVRASYPGVTLLNTDSNLNNT